MAETTEKLLKMMGCFALLKLASMQTESLCSIAVRNVLWSDLTQLWPCYPETQWCIDRL